LETISISNKQRNISLFVHLITDYLVQSHSTYITCCKMKEPTWRQLYYKNQIYIVMHSDL